MLVCVACVARRRKGESAVGVRGGVCRVCWEDELLEFQQYILVSKCVTVSPQGVVTEVVCDVPLIVLLQVHHLKVHMHTQNPNITPTPTH